MNPLLSLTDISLSRGSRTVLDKVNLTLHPSEILTLVGPNGAGKTCLVRIALGLLKADSGQREAAEHLVIGYVPQKLGLNHSLPISVERFLQLSPGKPDARQLANALAETGALTVLKSPLGRLSGGELQRVLLARALLRNPNLLVLDEPAQGVDVGGQEALYNLIGKVRDERGCAVLMVSHDLHLVMAATDRVLCLNRHVCCEGHPESVSAHPEYKKLFGEQRIKGLAVYSHHHDHHHNNHGDVCQQHGEHTH